jgi:mitochondrial fission process protein 1
MEPDHGDADAEQEATYNVFRHSALRYLGYANEVGESFRYQFPRFVLPSYVVASGYVLADAVNSGRMSYGGAIEHKSSNAPLVSVVATIDTLIWQTLASVVIPGAAINGIVRASRFALARTPVGVPVVVSTWAPTAIGLGSIPLIIHPIDQGVDTLMDSTYRQLDFPRIFGY